MVFLSPKSIGGFLFIITLQSVEAVWPASARSLSACAAITSLNTVDVLTQTLEVGYPDFVQAEKYWNSANGDGTPACVAFPQNAQELSDTVLVLQNFTDVGFAMKSGGHMPNVGFASSDGGILISFQKLNSTVYNDATGTADIGPGARWREVMAALDPFGRAVVGGRIGDVGVGGLLLGCGLSFLSAQYGLPCDSIVNYEVVLSTGAIVNANNNTNTDLFWALKGGGNQFGMVTKFTMTTVPIGQIWGGVRTFSGDSASALLNATHDFIENYHDPKAAIIVTGEVVASSLISLFVVFMFYNDASPPAGVFDKFDAIPSTSDTAETRSYAAFLESNDQYNLYGLRYLIRGITLPILPGEIGTDLLNYHYTSWKAQITPTVLEFAEDLGSIFSIAFQPMPYAIPAASARTNPAGNILGLKAEYGDHVWMEYDVSWLTPLHDARSDSLAKNITRDITAYAKRTYPGVKNSNYQSGDVEWESYNPIFLNDAMYDQQPLQSYGDETYERLKGIQTKYDPSGLFPTRTGGFKLI